MTTPKTKNLMNFFNRRLKHSHCSDRLRETFKDAIAAFQNWNEGEPEPAVTAEIFRGNLERFSLFDEVVNGKENLSVYRAYRIMNQGFPMKITISGVCGLLWKCTDILPIGIREQLESCGIRLGKNTYAAVARGLLKAIKQ